MNVSSNPVLLFTQPFSSLADPRPGARIKPPFQTLLFIVLSAMLCGAEGWEDFSYFGHVQKPWLSQYVDTSNGVPSADTFRRVFEALKPQEFERVFLTWVNALHCSCPVSVDSESPHVSKGT